MFISESFKKSLKIPKWVIRNRKMEEGKTIQWLKVKWTTTTKQKEKKKRKKDKQCLHKTITQKSKD
jgi:hypothetical protein